jgi:predicted nucleic acid-binding Zn ribbon protein
MGYKNRKSNEQPLKAAIEEFLDKFHLRDKLNQAKVIQSWEKVVGEMVARNTSQLHIRNKVLYVKVNSSALRNELLFARTKIMNALNKEAGGTVIEEIILN